MFQNNAPDLLRYRLRTSSYRGRSGTSVKAAADMGCSPVSHAFVGVWDGAGWCSLELATVPDGSRVCRYEVSSVAWVAMETQDESRAYLVRQSPLH
jgi:hypothetical protein